MKDQIKYALFGSGKTGGRLPELLAGEQFTVFNTKNPLTLKALKGHDVIISFVAGAVLLDHLPILLASGIPHVTGATGINWPTDLEEKIIHAKCKWMLASNFSLGMNIVKLMLEKLGQAHKLFQESEYKIHEIHHSGKLDSPSGTALSFERWLGLDEKVPISSERIGNVTGIHEVKFIAENEEISLRHEAKDRKIFASGALWAARELYRDTNLLPGLYLFEEYAGKKILRS